MNKANLTEYIQSGQAFGKMAHRILAANGDISKIRTNATLPYKAWEQIDTAVVTAARTRLRGVQDLINAGLVYSVTDGMSKMVLVSDRSGNLGPAETAMSPLSRTKRDRITFDPVYLPLPVTMLDFGFELRHLLASQNSNFEIPLDTASAEEAGRSVVEKVEDMLFNGSGSYSYGGGTIYGYTDHPDVNGAELSGDWSDYDAVESGEAIVQDVLAMISLLQTAKYYGPYVLYVPTLYGNRLNDDYKTNVSGTIRSRILEIPEISDVRTSYVLTHNKVVLVQMTSDVVRLVEGLPLMTVDWEAEGGYELNFKVITIMVPQIRSDKNGNCGVCLGQPS